MKLRSILNLSIAGLLMTGCLGGSSSSSDIKEDEVKEVFKVRQSLLNECVTIGLVGNRELAKYFNVDLEATGFSEEYDTLASFFDAKGASLGGEGLGALNNESMLYFRTAMHLGILLGNHLAESGAPELNDMKNLFLNLTARELRDDEYDALQDLAENFETNTEKKAAQFAAIVASAEVQCL